MSTLNAQTEQAELMVKQGFFSPIFYINGEKTIRDRFVSKIRLNEEAHRLFHQGVTRRAVGYTVSALGVIAMGVEQGRRSAFKKLDRIVPVTSTQNAILYGGWLAMIGGVATYYTATSWQKRAIEIYNGEPSSSLHLGPTNNGIGLSLRF